MKTTSEYNTCRQDNLQTKRGWQFKKKKKKKGKKRQKNRNNSQEYQGKRDYVTL